MKKMMKNVATVPGVVFLWFLVVYITTKSIDSTGLIELSEYPKNCNQLEQVANVDKQAR